MLFCDRVLVPPTFVQVLMLFDSLDLMDQEAAVKFISGLQQSDGSFTGDKWGESQRTKFKLSKGG